MPTGLSCPSPEKVNYLATVWCANFGDFNSPLLIPQYRRCSCSCIELMEYNNLQACILFSFWTGPKFAPAWRCLCPLSRGLALQCLPRAIVMPRSVNEGCISQCNSSASLENSVHLGSRETLESSDPPTRQRAPPSVGASAMILYLISGLLANPGSMYCALITLTAS